MNLRGLLWFRNPGPVLLLGCLMVVAAPSVWAAVTNAAASEAIPPLRPPRAELPPPFWEQHGGWVAAGAAFLVVLALAALWLLLRRRAPVEPAAALVARQSLAPLRALPEDGLLLSRVSQILRRYVGAAFDLPAGELTTTEFCRALGTREEAGPEISNRLEGFLRDCDLRKFAPSAPLPPLGAVDQAAELIDRVETLRAAAQARAGKP